MARSVFKFDRCGRSGAWLNTELMPRLAQVVDDICFVKSLHTEAINHDPAITFFQTGFQIAGRPSIGAWLSYGLGSENDNLPAFVAMTSNHGGQPLYDRLWGAGFLPSQHQGVRFRYAYNCLLARRLSERGVRFVQLFHRGWDTHGGLPKQLGARCKETDQATAGLITDLKQRGLLDETLVIWGGEFGRTVYCQGELTDKSYGRDHHPRCFTVWLAGGGIHPGLTWGQTDDFSYNVAQDPVSVHDLHATILHLLGIDHQRLTYRFQGRRYRLTDVHGKVVRGILA